MSMQPYDNGTGYAKLRQQFAIKFLFYVRLQTSRSQSSSLAAFLFMLRYNRGCHHHKSLHVLESQISNFCLGIPNTQPLSRSLLVDAFSFPLLQRRSAEGSPQQPDTVFSICRRCAAEACRCRASSNLLRMATMMTI